MTSREFGGRSGQFHGEDWGLDVTSAERAGGLTNENYIVESDQGTFFVRQPWETGIIDRRIEAENVLALSKNRQTAGIVPKCHLYVLDGKNFLDQSSEEEFNLPDGAMMTSYIPGRQLDGQLLQDERVRSALVSSLHTFHTSGVRFANEYDVFSNEVDLYRTKVEAEGYNVEQLFSREVAERIKDIEREARDRLPIGGDLATHNDLIVENLRLGEDGRVYLLDFEYSGHNTRSGLHYDLGTLFGGNMFHENPVTIGTFEQILDAAREIYDDPLDREQILYGALTNVMVMTWWGVVNYFEKDEKILYQQYVQKRAQGILSLHEQLRGGNL